MSLDVAAPAKTTRQPGSASKARATTRKAPTDKPKFSLQHATPAATPRPGDVRAPAPSSSAEPSRVVRALSELEAERARLDRVIARATRGGTFTPAQLLGLQAQIYRLSQDMEITSRVLDRSVGALKSVLGMQI